MDRVHAFVVEPDVSVVTTNIKIIRADARYARDQLYKSCRDRTPSPVPRPPF